MDILKAKNILKSIECGDDTELIKAIETVLAELDKQEKIINAMALDIECKEIGALKCQASCDCIECIKRYYEKKVSEE